MTATNKTKTVKSTIARLGAHATPKQIVDGLAHLAIDVSETHVRRIKFQLLRNEAKAERHRAQRPIKNRRKKRPQQRKTLGR